VYLPAAESALLTAVEGVYYQPLRVYLLVVEVYTLNGQEEVYTLTADRYTLSFF
jgi:hypothetical protein